MHDRTRPGSRVLSERRARMDTTDTLDATLELRVSNVHPVAVFPSLDRYSATRCGCGSLTGSAAARRNAPTVGVGPPGVRVVPGLLAAVHVTTLEPIQ